MDKDQVFDYRKAKLQEFIDVKFQGSKAALGRALGYRDGAFVGQMLRGDRPITEKTIAQIQSLAAGKGWLIAPIYEPDPFVGTRENMAIYGTTPDPLKVGKFGPINLSIEQLLEGLAAYLAPMDDDARDDAGDVLKKLAHKPENHARAAAMLTTAFHSGKRKAA